MFTRKYAWLVAGLMGAVASTACSSSDSTQPQVATTLTVASGTNAQTAAVGQPLPTPIAVTLVDQTGKAMSGATVTWTVMGSGGTVASPSSVTDASGNATVVWTLGNTAGVDSLQASVTNGPTTTITATATAGPAANLVKVSGDTQSVAVGAAGQPLVVKVTDQFGNPVAGASVTFATTGGGSLSVTTATTDATGQAQTVLTAAPTAGANTVTVTSGSLTPVTFTMTGT